ncbi:hypothetical protein BKA57DRAFT_451248 [Linnemannia elongata]|nr:hypothetical protein BKA57DRAFT_451248 [Linnemannia elongata]
MHAVRFVSSLLLLWHYWSGIRVHLTLSCPGHSFQSNTKMSMLFSHIYTYTHTMRTSPAVPLLITHICQHTSSFIPPTYLHEQFSIAQTLCNKSTTTTRNALSLSFG